MNPESNGDASFSATLDYSSGSSLQILGSGVGASLAFYGKGMKLCATGQSQASTNSLALTLPGDGGTYVLGGNTIICPDNTVITLNSQQMQSAGCTTGLANPSCTSGGDGGAGSGNVSCYIPSGTTAVCLLYVDPSVTQAQQDMTTCNDAKGTLGTACPTAGQVGCCAVPSSGSTTCYYGGTASQLSEACAYENGTWTAN
jgi:hypothetical protein